MKQFVVMIVSAEYVFAWVKADNKVPGGFVVSNVRDDAYVFQGGSKFAWRAFDHARREHDRRMKNLSLPNVDILEARLLEV